MNDVVVRPQQTVTMLQPSSPETLLAFAEQMAKGRITIPKHLQGSTSDCMAVIMQAAQWGLSPWAVAQKTYVVNGALGYEAQLVNAVIISNAPIEGRPEYEWFGDWDKHTGKDDKSKTHGVRVSATLRGESKPRVLDLTMSQVGVRNSPLWADDPKQQLAYLALKRWARLYCPDVILGVYSPDELQEMQVRDMGDAERSAPSRIEQAAGIATPATGAAKEEISQHPDAAILNEVIDLVRKGELQAAKELGKTLTTNAARTTARNMIRAAQEQKKASSNGDQGSSDTRKWTLDELKRVIKDADPKDHGRYLLEARRELSDQEYEDLIGFVDDLRGPGGPSGDDEVPGQKDLAPDWG